MICPLSAGEEIRKNQSTEILCTLQHLDYVEEVIRQRFVCERGEGGGGWVGFFYLCSSFPHRTQLTHDLSWELTKATQTILGYTKIALLTARSRSRHAVPGLDTIHSSSNRCSRQ